MWLYLLGALAPLAREKMAKITNETFHHSYGGGGVLSGYSRYIRGIRGIRYSRDIRGEE